jgi:hypothetical protein
MGKITNITGIGLPMAVWLASDGYDFTPDNRSISATSLLKPVRQILLKERLTEKVEKTPDLTDYIASRLGHSIHDGIEQSWKTSYQDAMQKLGYPQQIIDRIKINPETIEDGDLPVYLELRGSREIMGYIISGKFDIVVDGELNDFKTTSVYTWLNGSKEEDYCLQGSIYRWIHPEKITSDYITINFIFTDWQRGMTKANPNYPSQRVKEHRVQLMSLEETENWIKERLRSLEMNADKPESELPFCPEEALWRSETVWKYFSNPNKTDGRSTKNFTDKAQAYRFMQDKGGKGVVIEVPGVVKACGYCDAAPICTQKELYTHD